jgi:CRISPR-associated protein Cas1
MLFSELSQVKWVKLKAVFKASPSETSLVSSPLCAMEAITKAVSDRVWGITDKEWKNRPIFHFHGKPHNFKLNPDELYEVEFIFTDKDLDEVNNWRHFLQEYFNQEDNCRTFYPTEIFPPEPRQLNSLIEEIGEIPDQGEICLKFLTPLFFKPKAGKTRYYLDSPSFMRSLINRFNRLFNLNLIYEPTPEFQTLPYYWEYTEIKHKSHSQPGHYQFINGCIGHLYLRGNFSKVKPLLYLASELHAGTKFSNSLGYFILFPESLPYFDLRFPRLNEIREIAQDVLDRYDQALLNLIQPDSQSLNLKEIVTSLFNQINESSYYPLPYKVFTIKTEYGKERQVEQPECRDLIAGLYALRLLSPVLDKAFEEESIGFRKGKSREKAIELVREAINQGYLWVVESDIENFFPSINLNLLENLLDNILPTRDLKFKAFIKSILRPEYRIGEKIYSRTSGLAQGHPLSPCLTNLYLDAFDEQIKKFDVKLIRYADDFLIFCKTREQAESVIQEVEKLLSGLDLKIKPEKTSVKNVAEGFQFLGFNFQGQEADVFIPPDLHLFKKPLYITEPYVLVTVDSNSVCIKKEGKIIQTIPLRRISEILILEKAVLSTSLINRCIQNKIPLTIALNSGYYQTTLRPDSKDYFLVSSLHARKYASLSEAAQISLAKDVAFTKLKNYLHFIQQKYRPELNSLTKLLKETIHRLKSATDINEIRGLEGLAARHIYSNFNLFINNPAFHLTNRKRRPPDRINSLLNFGSYLLYSRINALIRSAGLNPYLGFLHSPADDYESLVSDLVDIFRPRLERFIIKIINLKIIDENHFEEKEGAFYLNKEGKHRFLSYFENELNQKPDNAKLSWKEQIALQVKIIKDWATKDSSLVFIRWSE